VALGQTALVSPDPNPSKANCTYKHVLLVPTALRYRCKPRPLPQRTWFHSLDNLVITESVVDDASDSDPDCAERSSNSDEDEDEDVRRSSIDDAADSEDEDESSVCVDSSTSFPFPLPSSAAAQSRKRTGLNGSMGEGEEEEEEVGASGAGQRCGVGDMERAVDAAEESDGVFVISLRS
jgi:hypothetical protein